MAISTRRCHRVLDQRWVRLERRAVKMLAGQEHHDEVGRRVKPVPVGLVRQQLDVLAQQPRVVAQMALALFLVARLVRVQHALKGSLGIDDDVLAARHADDEVRPQGPILAADRGLLDEIAVADHSRELDDVTELHLPPLPSRVRLAQRGH